MKRRFNPWIGLIFLAVLFVLGGCSDGTALLSNDGNVVAQSPVMPYGIDIEKSTNGYDADSAPGPSVRVGDEVVWTYVVRNRGYNALDNVRLTDDRLGDICPEITSIPPLESRRCTVTGIAQLGQYRNVAKVIASGGSTIVMDADPSHYFGENQTVPDGSIGDRVWLDTNRNGIQDPGEEGVPGVTVKLLDSNQQVINTTTTDAAGMYLFSNLADGTYFVMVNEPDSLDLTAANQGSDRNKDSNINPNTQMSGPITLANGSSDITVDAGLFTKLVTCTGRLGNLVWLDQNRNGIQDAGEPGIPNATVILRDSTGAEISRTTTDANGVYLFSELCSGTYTVDVAESSLPTGYIPTQPNQGTDDEDDSDGPTSGNPVTVTLPSSNTTDLSIDFGYISPNSGLTIEKSTTVPGGTPQDADNAPGPSVVANGRNQVTWTYVVTNTGDTRLTNVRVVDSVEGDVQTIAVLEPGESRTFTKTGTARPGAYENVGVVTGQPVDPNGNPVGPVIDDNDPSHYTGLEPNIKVEKATNSQDADNAPGPSIVQGGAVTWTYVVTNTGNVPLRLTSLQDSDLGTVSCPSTLLAPGASVTCTANGTAQLGQYQNIATAIGQPVDDNGNPIPNTGTVTDTDPSHYYGEQPARASLGDTVWEDLDRDGIQDNNEPGISGVQVKLLDENGNVIATTFTDASGKYSFTNLAPDRYKIMVTPPNGYEVTALNQGNNDALDSDIDPNTRMSEVTTLEPGENDPDWDAGLYRERASLGDRIWNDTDQDGVQDDGENGIPGVTVKLLDQNGTTLQTTTTDANGNYQFNDLEPGTYQIMVNVPADMAVSPKDQTSDPDDSDLNPNGMSDPVTLRPGENNPDVDGGLYMLKPAIKIEKSTNNQDADSAPGPTLTVGQGVSWAYQVMNIGNTPLQNVQVNDDHEGFICTIARLEPGETRTCYKAGIVQEGQYRNEATVSGQPVDPNGNPTGNPTTDTDPSHYNGKPPAQPAITVEKATNGQDADSAPGPSITTGDTVTWTYIVTNSGNTHLDNVVITDNRVNLGSNCQFASLAPGESRTCTATGTAINGQYNNIATATGRPVDENGTPIPNTPNVSDTDPSHYNGQPKPRASLGDYVWEDRDRDGIQDNNEPGVPNVEVKLIDENGNQVARTFTDASGNYRFNNLDPDRTYRVMVTPPDGYTITQPNQGNDDANDSDIDPNTRMTEPIDLDPGEHDPSWDAGLYRERASLGDRIWNDTDRDGVQDNGENGIPGVVVKLIDANGSTVAQTTTDANGNYSFTDLDPGTYRVMVNLPAGNAVSPKDRTNDQDDSDLNPNGMTDPITLSPGENNPDVDGGIYMLKPGIKVEKSTNGQDADSAPGPTLTVGQRVQWAYQVMNIGNTPLQNVQVTDDREGSICTISRLEPGETRTCFKAGTVTEGSYRNQATVTGQPVDPSGNPTGNPTTDTDPSHYTGEPPAQPAINVEKATNGQDADSAPGPSITAGDQVTWTYVVTNTGNVTLTNVVITDNRVNLNSSCQFASLAPGESRTCTATGTAVVGQYQNTATATGRPVDDNGNPIGNTVTDTDPSHYNGREPARASLGDKVWNDLDRDGIQDSNEPGVPNVEVKLIDENGNQVARTFTDASGNYLFTNLAPGQYKIMVTPPNGYQVTTPNQGGNDATDSDIDPTNLMSATTTLEPGENDRTWDAGLYQERASLGDTIFNDLDQDGMQDANEPGISGVRVKLIDSTGATFASTVTDANGNYRFTNLPPGNYRVMVVPPTGYQISPKDRTNDADDSDLNPNGMTDPVTLAPGENNPDVDGGLYQPAPDIQVEKSTNGQDADNAPGVQLVVGQQVTWRYVVTNTGDLPLSQVTVRDDREGVICTISFLGVGASDSCTKTGTVTQGAYRNQATASGQPIDPNGNPVGNPVTDTDPSNYTGLQPSIDVEKATNGQDADSTPGPSLNVGDQVTWTYVVTNTGDTTLRNVRVNDDRVTLNCAFSSLAPGQSRTCTATGTATLGQYRNVATATGQPVDQNGNPAGGNVTDTDPSHYTGAERPRASLGDRVWIDSDRDGIHDPDEMGLMGVTVKLQNEFGITLDQTVTDSNGNYRFDDLEPGNYKIMVNAPSGFLFTTPNQGNNDSRDSDINPATSMSPVTTLSPGENDPTLDAGLYKRRRVCTITDSNGSAPGHRVDFSVYLPEVGGSNPDRNHFVTSPPRYTLTFTEDFLTGTARLQGQAIRRDNGAVVNVDITFSGRTNTPPPGSPYIQSNVSGVSTADWYYYTNMRGTLQTDNSFYTINRVGAAFQVGTGANNQDSQYGGSGWFTASNRFGNLQGDFNFGLNCPSGND